jgi:hypothetical protein
MKVSLTLYLLIDGIVNVLDNYFCVIYREGY